ncbi:nucleotidyltransferase family protein [Geminocystis sp.]|uniref:nucleotidyltransferase family protein n=1 Tax=Geminocystis sp. TaxID=2664100 RepID=UPI0035945E7E
MTILTSERKQEIINEVLLQRKNHNHFLELMKKRQIKVLEIAQRCADFLKSKYGVTKVVLFGSSLNYKTMNDNSDIDLAVWNLSEKDYFQAIGFLLEIAEYFTIDLVEIQYAKPYILESINEGIEL